MAKKSNKNKETFTVKDFKMWLLGLTEFQEAGWTPNAKQWKTILEKVELLEDNVQYMAVPEQVPVAPRQPSYDYYDEPVAHGGGQQPPARFLDEPHYVEPAPIQPRNDSGFIELDITKRLI